MAVAQLPPQGCPASGPPPNSDRGGGSAALQVDGDFQFQNNPGGVIFPGANQPRAAKLALSLISTVILARVCRSLKGHPNP